MYILTQTGGDIRDKTDHGNGQPEYGQQHINDSYIGDGDPMGLGGDLSTAAGSAALSATLGVGIKEYMNVPWMPLVDIDTEPAGNSLDPSSDRREQSGRGFTNGGGRAGNKTTTTTTTLASGSNSTAARPPADLPAADDDQFPYDEVVAAGRGANGTAGDIREPVLRPKSRFRMYRMPDGSGTTSAAGNGTPPSSQVNGSNASSSTPNGSTGSTATAERSFIVHLLPQKLMNMIEQAEKYARMAFSPFMWPSKERTQRALKHFPRSVYYTKRTEYSYYILLILFST